MVSTKFHRGELELQERAGDRKKTEMVAERVIRDYMTDEHREFFQNLEYIFIGTIGDDNLPHASILTGEVGFCSTPDSKTLVIKGREKNAFAALVSLASGAAIGILGLDLSNRRRNRLHGRIIQITPDSLSIGVSQSYGNCPKYISLRNISDRVGPTNFESQTRDSLNLDDINMLKASDTFFIASYQQDGSGAEHEGADMSHRGGDTGFFSIDDPTTLTIPDYKGNNLFNTFGNLLLNPSVALLFIDFNSGDQLHIQGHATIDEDENASRKFLGALRLLRVKIQAVEHRPAATSLRWDFIEPSPFNPKPAPS